MQVTRRLFLDYIKPPIAVAVGVLSDVDGLDKAFKCARNALDLHIALHPSTHASLAILTEALKGCSEVMLPFQFFKIIQAWCEIKKKSWAGIASLVNGTALTTIGLVKFLAKIKIFDLAVLTSKIGAVPVLGTLLQMPLGVLVIGATGFNLIDTKIKLNKNATLLQSSRGKLRPWIGRCRQWSQHAGISTEKELTTHLQASWVKPGGTLTPEQQEKLKMLIASCVEVTQRLHTTQNSITLSDTAQAYISVKCRKWQTDVGNLKMERSKSVFSMVNDISLIAFTCLGLAAAVLGIAALTASSFPMLILGLVVSSIAIGKKIYDTTHKTPHEVPKLQNLEDAIVQEYKHKKQLHLQTASG